MTSEDDGLASLLRRFPPPPDEPCPDDNLVAAWAERRLEGERLARVEEHLSRCDACRAAGGELRGEFAIPSLSTARASRGVRLRAVAAAALLALGAGALYVARRPGPSASDEARLVEVAQRLSREHPELYADLKLVDAAERAATSTDVTRAGLAVLEPAGTIFPGSPRMACTEVAGATSYEFTLYDARGKMIWRRPSGAATTLAAADRPELDDGTYIVDVAATGALGKASASRTFRVASAAARTGWGQAVETVRRAEPDLADLVLAHLAVRRDYLLEARRLASAWDRAHGTDSAAGRDLEVHVRRLLLWPEGAAPRDDGR